MKIFIDFLGDIPVYSFSEQQELNISMCVTREPDSCQIILSFNIYLCFANVAW